MPTRKVFGGRKPKRTPNLGRRGAILVVMGVAWIMLGLATFSLPPTPGTENLIHNILLGRQVEAVAWMVSGFVAIIFAHRTDDEYGFLALYIMPAVRALSFFIGWLDAISPYGGPGYPAGWYSVIFYIIMILFVVICAGWPEPARSPHEVLPEVEESDYTNGGGSR